MDMAMTRALGMGMKREMERREEKRREDKRRERKKEKRKQARREEREQRANIKEKQQGRQHMKL